jgi:segregation and condensation protein B
MYATTRHFLDYFNLKSLDQLPALAEIRDLDTLNAELGFSQPLPDDTDAGEGTSGLTLVGGTEHILEDGQGGADSVTLSQAADNLEARAAQSSDEDFDSSGDEADFEPELGDPVQTEPSNPESKV